MALFAAKNKPLNSSEGIKKGVHSVIRLTSVSLVTVIKCALLCRVVMCQSSTSKSDGKRCKTCLILLVFPRCSSGTNQQCDPVLESEAKKNTACGMITDPTGSMLVILCEPCHGALYSLCFLLCVVHCSELVLNIKNLQCEWPT